MGFLSLIPQASLRNLAGAIIVIDIAAQDFGGRGYSCRDLEGHLWWFSSYAPWKA